MHILVVEDNYDVRMLVVCLLESEGYEVTTATDGMAALQIESTLDLDMVILDVNLPLVDGYDVCKRIKARRDIPIVMLTVRAETEDIARAKDAGADLHLAKPFDLDDFFSAVNSLKVKR